MSTPHTVFQNLRRFRKSRTLVVFLLAVMLVSIAAGRTHVAISSPTIEPTVVLDPTTAPMLSGTFQVINNGPGEQTDPHTNCDRATYLNDDNQGVQSIHYFEFANNTDHVVPGNGSNYLADVYGGLITFSESTFSGPVVVLLDVATQTRTLVPGFNNSYSRLGGNLVAFENRSFTPIPWQTEISVYDRTTGIVSRLTNDLSDDRHPVVSPTGNAIVWQKCQAHGLGCDIYAALQTSPGVFTTQALAVGEGEDRFPKTNGDIAVYISSRSGEYDIYIQSLTGGTEQHLAIPGDQRDVSIAGNLLSFVSSPGGFQSQYDIYVYDLSTANLYRVTNTPVSETLNSLTVCNGSARIVYAAPGMDFDVYSFTFHVPSSAQDDIEDLIALVESFGLPRGPENSLITKLDGALAALEASDTATACDLLGAFINECQAQAGKKLTEDQTTQLINAASQIKFDLGCQ